MGMIRAMMTTAALVAAGTALAEPSYQRVTGVAADDTLNIRSAPDADSADIGDLAPDARGIEVLGLDTSGDWARIGQGEGDGWVATRYLTEDDIQTLGATSVPGGAVCSGTEPFWALSFEGSDATFSHPEDGDSALTVDSAIAAEGFLGSPAQISLRGPDTRAKAIVTGAECSDGMSDRSYGWSIYLTVTRDGQDRFLSGCCHLPRD